MKLRHLRYFVKIVEAGSFSGAAAAIHIAQPALSQQVAELEQMLGVELLHRNARGVRPTAAGEILYAEASSILRQVERIPGMVLSAAGDPQGIVSVGMSSTLAASLAGALMEASRKTLPKVSLRFVTHGSQSLRERVTEQTLDLAVIFEDEPTANFVRIPLFRQRLYLIRRKKTARSPQSIRLESLADVPLIMPSPPNFLRTLLDRSFAEADVVPNIVAETDLFSGVLSAVQTGMGETILPKGDFSDVPGNTKVFALPIEPPIYLTANLVHSKEIPLTRAGEAVRDFFGVFVRGHLQERPLPGAEWIGS